MTTVTLANLADHVEIETATISELACQTLLTELDFALAELVNLHTRGGYVKKSEIMDMLLDFRQSIENFPR